MKATGHKGRALVASRRQARGPIPTARQVLILIPRCFMNSLQCGPGNGEREEDTNLDAKSFGFQRIRVEPALRVQTSSPTHLSSKMKERLVPMVETIPLVLSPPLLSLALGSVSIPKSVVVLTQLTVPR